MPRRRHWRVLRNPTSLMDFAMLAGVGLGGLWLVNAMQQSLQRAQGDLGQAIGQLPGQLGDAVGKVNPFGGSGAMWGTTPCFQTRVGNTRLTFNVNPWNPPRQEGAPVEYSGQLNGNLTFLEGNYGPIRGAEIQFYDTRDCSGPFARVGTDDQGRYSFTSYLYPQDLDGYAVFAYFPGAAQGTLGINAEPAQSGVITVRPGA